MTDDFIGSAVVAFVAVIVVSLMHWAHARSEKKRRFSDHYPDMRVLNREPYSAQDAYNRRMWRQS